MQQGAWRPGSVSSPGARRRTATTSSRSGYGLLACAAMLIALLGVRSFHFVESLAREHGAAGLLGRAVLFSCLSVVCLLLAALRGNHAWDGQSDDDVEWLSTLPVPAWALQVAKLAEAALWNPFGWLLLVPFFAGLALHSGLGLLAPLVALGIFLPIVLCCSLLGGVIDAAGFALSRSRAFRVLRFVGPPLGILVLLVWLGAAGLDGLSDLRGPAGRKVDVLGRWLDFSNGIPWLPFSEPARALLSFQEAPARALAWFGVFAVEMAALLGLGTFVLSKLYRADLVRGRADRHGVRGVASGRSRSAPRRSFGGALGAAVAKEWLWLRRSPARAGGIVANIVLVNAGAMLWMSRAPGGDAALTAGVAPFGVAAIQLWGLQAASLEAERPALWHWAVVPRPMSWVLVRKTLFAAGLAAFGSLPIAVYTGHSLPAFSHALPALAYGAACIVVLAFFHTALWLRSVSPGSATSPLAHAALFFKLSIVAGILGVGFRLLTEPASLVQLFVVITAFACTFWRTSLDHVPFVLDSSVIQPRAFTATYALATIVVLGAVRPALYALFSAGMPPWRAAALAFIIAGVATLTASVLWLRLRREVTGLRERFGLGPGRGLRVVLREGSLWSLPAIAINFGFWEWIGPQLAESTDAFRQPATATVLRGSALALVSVLCVAAPLVEELLFRGMLYRSLRSGWGVALSLLISAAVFMVDHPLVAAVPILSLAACATLAFERSRSLYAAMLVHAVYNGVIAWHLLSR